jgi:hypothetical protein
MHNSIEILGMNFKWYQPEPWIPVEQRERFAKRVDGAGFLNRRTTASLIFFREHVVKGRFVGPHQELPGFSGFSLLEKHDQTALTADFDYGFADVHMLSPQNTRLPLQGCHGTSCRIPGIRLRASTSI